jgi:predicted ATPase
MIDRAFPGVTLEMAGTGRDLHYPDFPHRQFEPSELSDGTLRFLGLAGVLMAYRLPPLVALNEPASDLHPDLIEPPAEMIVQAAQRTREEDEEED